MSATKYLILAIALMGLNAHVAYAVRSNVVAPNMQSVIAEETAKCESGSDSMACIKVRAMRFLDTVMTKDNYKISDVEVKANGYQPPAVERKGRAHGDESDAVDGLFEKVEKYVQGHDMTVDLPLVDAKVHVSTRNLANDDELSLSVKFADNEAKSGDVVEGKGKKGNIFKKGKKKRLRKMVMPIMVLILLKALTVIPMAIGILKIKALNALGLGFLSFIVSVGLAIFQLCKKLAAEHHHSAHITAHGPWDGRAIGISNVQPAIERVDAANSQYAQNVAYNAYA